MDMKSHAGHEGHSRRRTEAADAQTHHQHAHQAPEAPTSPPQLKDPVCGMTVTEQSQHRAEHDGRPYYFCSAKCLAKFTAEPAQYVQPELPAAPAAEATPGTIYTCPMHPEVRQDHPGNCPKCGMTLEPMLPTLDDDENPELGYFSRRFWWTLPLTVIVTLLAMAGHRLQWFGMGVQSWVELVLSVPIVLWAGWPFFVRGVQSIRLRSPNMWTLIGLGTGAAFAYSVVATLAPDAFPASFQAMGRVAVYFEAAAVIISLTLLGQILELKARSQTSAAIKSLLGLAPKTARRIAADGSEEDVPLTHVQVDNPAVDNFLRGARESTEKREQLQKERAQAEAAAAKKARESTPARRSGESLPLWLKRLAFLGGVVGALVLYGLLAHHFSVAVASGVLWLGLAIPSAMYLHAIWTMGGTDGWGKLVAIVLSGAAIAAPFVGTLAAYTVYKLVVSARARRKAILFLIGVIVVIVLNALERWLLW